MHMYVEVPLRTFMDTALKGSRFCCEIESTKEKIIMSDIKIGCLLVCNSHYYFLLTLVYFKFTTKNLVPSNLYP